MLVITLANGIQRQYNKPVSTFDVACDINSDLSKCCIAGRVNNKLIDAVDLIESNSELTIITSNDDDGLYVIRHSCAHLLSYAIKQLWPDVQLVSGSVINNGFYYDVDFGNYTLTNNDLKKIEDCMHVLANKNYNILKKKVTWAYARQLFILRNEHYKVIILDKQINKESYVNLYYYGDYVFLFGPHVPNMSFCHYFKLQKISGVYWCGDSKNKMLQRVYGTAWSNEYQLKHHLCYLQEVVKRDHRIIGKQLNLFHIPKETPGMVFWHNDGLIIFHQLEFFMRKKLKEYNYQEVKTPFLMSSITWKHTGHFDNYYENIFITSSENHEYCIKPMNCPGHIEIFKQGIKSYRDLPLRMSEFGSCHRNEPSGSLHGLMRTRNFTQDDAHIFCSYDQIFIEVDNCIKMIYDIYHIFGFKNILVKLSTRPKKSIGNDEIWNRAINDLVNVLVQNNIKFEYQFGEGAFYGPKIEFILLDCLNRSWQCGTIQLDFVTPKILNVFYIEKNNERTTPVIIHRAIFGSIERFFGIVTEEYAGFYPTWLAPIQIVIINITNLHIPYVKVIEEKLLLSGLRVKVDLRNEKISFKIREHILHKVPYIIICGDKEVHTEKLSIRTSHNKNISNININEFIKKLQSEICNYTINQWEE